MGATKAELWTQLLQEVKILDELYKFCASNSANYAGMEEILQEAFVGTHVGSTQQQITSMRSQLSNLIKNGSSVLTPVLLELAKIGYSSLATSVVAALIDIYDGMIATTPDETVKYRNFTFGSVAAGGGNNGTGTLLRCTKDKNDYDLEGGFAAAGITKCEITKDFASGKTSGNEEALLYGSGIVKTDEIAVGDASKDTLTLTAKTAADGLLTNGNFETSSGSGATLAFTGWTLSTATDFEAVTTDFYRGTKCIRFKANANILQYLATVTLDTTRPVMALVHFKRENSCDGTLTLRIGTKTVAVSLVAQSGWVALELGTGAAEEGWYDQFKEDYTGLGIRVQLSLASRTTGELLVDEFHVIQPSLYDGKYYLLKAGATDFLEGDSFTFTDSVANTGRTQYWLARLFGKYFPHTSGTPTYADA